MNTLLVILTAVMIITSLLLCLVVLVQNSKGGGLSSSFSSSNAIFGVRKTTNGLEKTTWGLAAFIVVLSIAFAYAMPTNSDAKDALIEQAQQEEKTNPYNLPAGTAAPKADATAPAAAAAATTAPADSAK